jgi:hypothetical protein
MPVAGRKEKAELLQSMLSKNKDALKNTLLLLSY